MEDASYDDDVPLPGFRFHPTDEELVGFYLRRKVEEKPIKIELIKQTDIYKHDPWDLPKYSNNNGDKEWYFFCKRGRKYKNSIRPNRVTGSGFWKATGIDKPVYSSNNEQSPMNPCVIGLKKSLVYYTGSAGKGTKTEWMMHEFRLPQTSHDKSGVNKHVDATNAIDQEAEVWTLCRIMKRDVSYNKRYNIPDWRESATKKRSSSINDMNPIILETSSETCSMGSNNYCYGQSNNYICFSNMPLTKDYHQADHEMKPYHGDIATPQQFNAQPPSSTNLFSGFACNDEYMNELFTHGGDWEHILDDSAGAASTKKFC